MVGGLFSSKCYVIVHKALVLLCRTEETVRLRDTRLEYWQNDNDLERFLRDIPGFQEPDMRETIRQLRLKKVNTLGKVLDLFGDDNNELKLGISDRAFRQIVNHAADLRNHFHHERRTAWKEELKGKLRLQS